MFRHLQIGLYVAVSAGALLAGISPTSAGQTGLGTEDWRQSFVGCTAGASPFYEQVILAEEASPRPLMKIGTMQAWAITNDQGEQELALTTEDGLTIVGKVVGPQGEDISGALLATAPSLQPVASKTTETPDVLGPNPTSIAPASSDAMAVTTTDAQSGGASGTAIVDPLPLATALSAAPTPTALAPVPPVSTPSALSTAAAADITTPPWAQPAAASTPQASSAPDLASIEASMPPAAQTPEQLLDQATQFSVWFSAGTPKPGARVAYFLADPLCPHCAEATRKVAPLVESGDLDLRVILMPITGKEAYAAAVSIIQSGDVGTNFLAHEKAHMTSKASPLTLIDPSEYDANVTAAMARNIMWFRKNQMRSVPFWIYPTAAGVKTAVGPIDPSVLDEAVALADPAATEPAAPIEAASVTEGTPQ